MLSSPKFGGTGVVVEVVLVVTRGPAGRLRLLLPEEDGVTAVLLLLLGGRGRREPLAGLVRLPPLPLRKKIARYGTPGGP